MKNEKKKRGAGRSARQAPSRPWALLLAVGGLALIAAAWWSLSGSTSRGKTPLEVSGAPSLKVNQEKVDLGNVKLGEWVTVSFELSNAGDQPLRFTEQPFIEVAAGC
jgi:hypothetical protein